MAKQLQLRRGTTAQHSTFTGAVGEVTIDTDKDVVVVHDGATVGGFPSQKELISGTNIKTVNSTSLLGSGDVAVQATLVSGTNIKTVNGSSLLGSGDMPIYTGFKNRIINGAMRIDQRNAGASVSVPNSDAYIVDRWLAQASVSAKYSAQQNAGSVTPPAGFTNYLGCTSSSAYLVGASEVFNLSHRVEGFNVADLAWGTANAKTVTLSFLVYSSLTGTFGGAIRNSAGNRSYPFSYTINAQNTWETKTITIAGDTTGTWLTNNGIGVNVVLGLGVGSTYQGTAGAWAAGSYYSATGATSVVGTNGATFYITGVQLEKGSTATSFDYRPYGTELALCQRYYEKKVLSTEPKPATYWTSNGGVFESVIQFNVEKRVIPTLSVTGIPQWSVNEGTWTNTSNPMYAASASVHSFNLRAGNASIMPQVAGAIRLNGDVVASAEL